MYVQTGLVSDGPEFVICKDPHDCHLLLSNLPIPHGIFSACRGRFYMAQLIAPHIALARITELLSDTQLPIVLMESY